MVESTQPRPTGERFFTAKDNWWFTTVLVLGGLFFIYQGAVINVVRYPAAVILLGAFWVVSGAFLHRRARGAKVMSVIAMLLLAGWGLERWLTDGSSVSRIGMLIGGVISAFIYASLDVSPRNQKTARHDGP